MNKKEIEMLFSGHVMFMSIYAELVWSLCKINVRMPSNKINDLAYIKDIILYEMSRLSSILPYVVEGMITFKVTKNIKLRLNDKHIAITNIERSKYTLNGDIEIN